MKHVTLKYMFVHGVVTHLKRTLKNCAMLGLNLSGDENKTLLKQN